LVPGVREDGGFEAVVAGELVETGGMAQDMAQGDDVEVVAVGGDEGALFVNQVLGEGVVQGEAALFGEAEDGGGNVCIRVAGDAEGGAGREWLCCVGAAWTAAPDQSRPRRGQMTLALTPGVVGLAARNSQRIIGCFRRRRFNPTVGGTEVTPALRCGKRIPQLYIRRRSCSHWCRPFNCAFSTPSPARRETCRTHHGS
jgi:hypothetical protein